MRQTELPSSRRAFSDAQTAQRTPPGYGIGFFDYGSNVELLQRDALPHTDPLISPRLARWLGSHTLDCFALDQATLSGHHLRELNDLAATLQNLLSSYPGGLIAITGHADGTGSEEHNETLGQRRAEAVERALLERGIDASRISTRSAGETELRAPNESAEPLNRRVFVQFLPTPIVTILEPISPSPPREQAIPPAPNLDLTVPPSFFEPQTPNPFRFEPTRPPTATDRPLVRVRPGGLFWLDIVINPPAPLPIEAHIAQRFRERGILLSDHDLQTLMQSRTEGIGQIERTIAGIAPGLDPATRANLAERIADAMLSRSIQSQLKREYPTTLEEQAARERQLEDLFGPTERRRGVEGGIRLRIHF
jgi:hypothetical protein